MQKAFVIMLLLAAFVAGVWAQTTVNLLPDVQVTAATRASAVWAVCRRVGYTEAGQTSPPPSEGMTWSNSGAMWTAYRQWILQRLGELYRQEARRWAEEQLPGYDLGVE